MPTPAIQGGWHDSPLEISSANKWLKDLLISAGFDWELDLIGTHTCNVSGLSWCSKYGLDLQTRALLGYHLLKEFGSTLTYSRDALSQPLRLFDEILKAIRSGKFLPDMTRSGRKVDRATKRSKRGEAASAAGTAVTEDGYEAPEHYSLDVSEAVDESYNEVDEVVLTSDSDDSSSCSDSSPDMSFQAIQVLSKQRPSVPTDTDGKTAYYHPASCILHFRLLDQTKLRCGKALTSTYVKISWDKVAGLINCCRCFAKQ